MRPDGGDQGWLNSIYLWEMFDIGHEYNLMAITEQTLGHAPQIHGKCYNLTLCRRWQRFPRQMSYNKTLVDCMQKVEKLQTKIQLK